MIILMKHRCPTKVPHDQSSHASKCNCHLPISCPFPASNLHPAKLPTGEAHRRCSPTCSRYSSTRSGCALVRAEPLLLHVLPCPPRGDVHARALDGFLRRYAHYVYQAPEDLWLCDEHLGDGSQQGLVPVGRTSNLEFCC